MAKTYKKKQDNFLRNALIVFGSIFVILTIVFIVSSLGEPKYKDFEHLQTFEDFDNQIEDKYAVYYYSTECGACAAIKNRVLDFALENELGLKVYFLELLTAEGDYRAMPASVTGTPNIIFVENGTVVDTIQGSDVITDFFDSVKDGFDPFE